jgi:hypothetical protein
MFASAYGVSMIRVAALGVAAAMALIGAYLIDPAIIDLGYGLRAERTGLVGLFLLFAALFLGLRAANVKFNTGHGVVDVIISLFFTLALMLVSFVQAALAAAALFAEPFNGWALLFIVPAALALLVAVTGASGDAAPDEEGDEEEAEDASIPTMPDSGKSDVAASVWLSLQQTFYVGVITLVMLLFVGLGLWLYHRLSGVLFEGETFDIARLGDAHVETKWLLMLAVGLVVPLVVGGFALGRDLFHWISLRGVRGGNRDLNAAEIAFIDRSANEVRAYAKARGYDKWVFSFQMFTLLLGFGAVYLGMMAVLAIVEFAEMGSGPSLPIVVRSMLLSTVTLCFACIMLGVMPNSVLARVWQAYAERGGWIGSGEENDFFTVDGRLTKFVRTGRLKPDATFRPGDFLRDVSLSVEPYVYPPGVVLLLAGLIFLSIEWSGGTTLTATHIERADAWSMERIRYAYGDVRQVSVVCFLTNKGETAERYELEFTDGRSIDLFTKARVTQKIEAYEAVDRMLRAAGVPVVAGAHPGLLRSGESGYDPACVVRLAEDFPVEMRDRVRALFRVDEGG